MKTRAPLRPTLSPLVAASALALAACSGPHTDPAAAVAHVAVTTTAAIPNDGQCTHIKATRLGDFAVSDYQGPLAGATLQALTGEHRVTATAYPAPCAFEPATPPWIINPVIVTFTSGANTLPLEFKRNVPVAITPVFDNDPAPLLVRPGSFVRTGRNSEDIAGPNFGLDGWELRQFGLPPAGGDTVLFTTQNRGVPYSPRGVARLPDGTFVFQLSEVNAPLYPFDSAGNPLGTWTVSYAPGLSPWDNTDGIEAIDATHFVRTGYGGAGINCDADGNCIFSGLDLMTKITAPDGKVTVQVTSQIPLPAPYSDEYPVGVSGAGSGLFAVTTLPLAPVSHLILVDSLGNLKAGPVELPGDVEGLADDGVGHLVTVDYVGQLRQYSDTTLALRSGGNGNLGEGARVSGPMSLAWRPSSGNFIVLSQQRDLVFASPDFTSATPIGLDIASVQQPQSLDYKADSDELLIGDFRPFTDPATTIRATTIHFYNLATKLRTRSLQLNPGLGLPLRLATFAYVQSSAQLAAHFIRPGVVDAKVDAAVYVLNLDGSLAYSFDLAPLGFVSISSVRYQPATDELFLTVRDAGRTRRILVTDRFGTPHRSYRLDALPDFAEAAPITSGPFAGDFGAVTAQPSAFARIALP